MEALFAGKLDRRVRFERLQGARDAAGQVVGGWHSIATVYAFWRPASAREQVAASEAAATVTDVFEIRYSSRLADLNPKDRLHFKGKDYQIVSAIELGRKAGIRITASARADK